MHIFYCPDFASGSNTLDEIESHHCVKVLRLRQGTKVDVIDGKGGYYSCELAEIHPKHCKLDIIDSIKEYNKRNYYLHIAIAPTKQTERFENFLDKAIEIGIDRITPIICTRSERKKLRMDRVERVAQAAAKQSKNAYMPQIDDLINLKDLIKQNNYTNKFIASCSNKERIGLEKTIDAGDRTLILIGPEGDFTEDEINLAGKHGFKNISLGENRLRTETAGIVASQIIKTVNRLKQ